MGCAGHCPSPDVTRDVVLPNGDVMMSNGLMYDHAYGILDVQEVVTKKPWGGEERVCLIRLRNPWGKGEWNGRWGDGGKEWTEELIERFEVSFGNDGTFFMCLEDFVNNFDVIHVLRLLTDDIGERWDKFVFKGEWGEWEGEGEGGGMKKRAGGCQNYVDTFLENPQMAIRTYQVY